MVGDATVAAGIHVCAVNVLFAAVGIFIETLARDLVLVPDPRRWHTRSVSNDPCLASQIVNLTMA